jgi:hypothetical protein
MASCTAAAGAGDFGLAGGAGIFRDRSLARGDETARQRLLHGVAGLLENHWTPASN